MKNILAAAFITLLAMSCEKKSTVQTDSQTDLDSMEIPATNEPIASSTLQTCYLQVTGKDSLFLTVEDNLGTFTGNMRYKNFEKDSSSGTVIGSQNGDTIKLIFTFEAEGMTSDREIFFLKKNGRLVEGIGESENEENAVKYKRPLTLKYDGEGLKQVDCTHFEQNFK